MSLVYWVGAFVIGIVAQAFAYEAVSLLDGSPLWFLVPVVGLLTGASGLWLWLLVSYPVWSLARGKPPAEQPHQLLGLALVIVGTATVISVLLDALQGVRALAPLRSLFDAVRLSFRPASGASQGLLGGTGSLAALLLGLGAILVGGYLGRKG